MALYSPGSRGEGGGGTAENSGRGRITNNRYGAQNGKFFEPENNINATCVLLFFNSSTSRPGDPFVVHKLIYHQIFNDRDVGMPGQLRVFTDRNLQILILTDQNGHASRIFYDRSGPFRALNLFRQRSTCPLVGPCSERRKKWNRRKRILNWTLRPRGRKETDWWSFRGSESATGVKDTRDCTWQRRVVWRLKISESGFSGEEKWEIFLHYPLTFAMIFFFWLHCF